MAETLRDLVVSLSLNTDNFTRNIRSVQRQIQEAQSEFQLAAAGIRNFEQTTEGLTAKLTSLERTLSLQADAVDQYEKALTAARDKLQECYDRQNDYAQRLQEARQKQADLAEQVQRAQTAYDSYKNTLGETDSATIAAKQNLDALKDEYRQASDEVKKLEGQNEALKKSTQNAADAVSTANVKLNQANAAMRTTQAAIAQTNQELALAQTQWNAAGTAIDTAKTALTTIGKQMQQAESRFKLATAGIKDMDTSAEGLSAKMTLLREKITLQEQAIAQYEAALEAAIQQLEASQQANDPEKVRQASNAVIDAQTSLNNARAALARLRAQLVQTNQQLQTARSAWTQAGRSLTEFGDRCTKAGQAMTCMGKTLSMAVTTPMLRATNATELFSNTQNTANAAWKSGTELATVAEQRYATTTSKLTNLKNSALLFAQTIGDDLNPTVHRLIEGAGEVIDRLMALDGTQRMQIIRWAAMAAAIGPVILVTGKVTKAVGTVSKGLGTFATAVGKAGGGFKGFLSVLGKSPAVWAAVAIAVVAGTAALIDYASGAKQAREALEGMKKTAEDWKNTAADTFYGRSNGGLSFFGMSTDDFKKESAHSIQAANDWYTGLIAVWTDGKRETNAIVKVWTDSWKQLTASTREGLAGLKENADANGYTGLSAQIQADMDTLDAMDKEISALLKKRQSKYFTEEDQRRLQELIAARGDIEIKYHLVEADAGGFDTIRDKMAAEVARAQARGQTDTDVTVYQNAIAAAGQGMAAVNAQIDAQYDKEYALIQLIEDSTERQAAMDDLNARYTTHDWGWLNDLIGSDVFDRMSWLFTDLDLYAKNVKGTWKDWRLIGSNVGDYNNRISREFDPDTVAALQNYVAEMVTAIQNGQEVSEEDLAHLQTVISFLNSMEASGSGESFIAGMTDTLNAAGITTSAETLVSDLQSALDTALQGADFSASGEQVSAGVGEGMRNADMSEPAEAMAGSTEEAANQAFDIHLPSRRMMPTGEQAAAGIAEGMKGFSFTSAAGAVSGNAVSSLNAVLNSATLRPAGLNAMLGLRNGILAGRSSVISAMRSAARSAVNAAKSELKIHSSSRVFEDEVGVMTMRGLGKGVLKESKAQAKIIRNASRYLTGEAREGTIVAGNTTNTHTYHQDSSVNFTGSTFYIREEKDVQALAIEIAALTRRRQHGRGLRMA